MEKYKRKPNTQCFVCKKAMYRRPSEIARGRVFCSQRCYGLSCRKEHPCVVCGAFILASAHKKTCSRRCANINRSGISYKRGRPKDKVAHHRSLRDALFASRGASCGRCSYDKRQILQIHHRDRNRRNNDMENLELLCPNCHTEEHLLEKNA